MAAELKDRISDILSDITYQEFCDRVNAVDMDGTAKMSKSFVYEIISGTRQPGYKTIVRIARAFNLSCDYLLGLSDVPSSVNDDVNTAANTTGLTIKTIENLKTLHKALSAESSDAEKLFFDTLQRMIAEAALFYTSGNRLNYPPLICLVSDFLESLELLDGKTELKEYTHTTAAGKTFRFSAALMVSEYAGKIANWCSLRQLEREARRKAFLSIAETQAGKKNGHKAADKDPGRTAAAGKKKAGKG